MRNGNIDRFDSYIVDESEECANCGASRPYSDMIFDEHAEHFYCDNTWCFEEWASDNLGDVIEYYFVMNC